MSSLGRDKSDTDGKAAPKATTTGAVKKKKKAHKSPGKSASKAAVAGKKASTGKNAGPSKKDGTRKKTSKARPPLKANGSIDEKGLIEQYLPYVRSIAGKVKKGLAKGIEFDDLVEYGMVGLLESARRYDPKYGANFMTFSYYRIRGAIYDGLRSMGWVSRNEYAKYRFEERATTYLANVADRQSFGDDGKSVEAEVEELADTVQNLVTIFVTSLEGMEGLQVEDTDSLPIDIAVSDVQVKAHLRDALSRMPEQERTLLSMYYFKEMSLQEVGDQLGLSKSWTSRLHAKAIEKLSRILRDLMQE